jgi:hypothetical protein
VLSNLPVTRDVGTRTLFLVTAAISVAVVLWTNSLGTHSDTHGLTAIFFFLFTKLDHSAAICSLLVLLAAIFIPARDWTRGVLHWTGGHPLTVAAAATVISGVGSFYVYHHHPLAMDEYAQVFQSQVFASGHLAGRFPVALLDWLVPQGFQNNFLMVSRNTGEVASAYWPSFALLLTPFAWLGIPWMCNPVISGLTLLGIYRLALRIYGSTDAAGFALLFTVASPVFFANGISYYSMPAHLLANTVFALLLSRPSPMRALTAGVVGSIALTLHNPVPHLLFALPWLIWVITRENGIRLGVCLAAGYAPLCLLLGLGWFWFTLELRHVAAGTADSAQADGVQHLVNVFALPDTGVLFARLVGIAKIWIWAVPGLLVLAALGAWRWRSEPICRLLLWSGLATLIGFLFVPADQGHGWGFRYFHTAWLVLPLLAAGAFSRSVDSRPTPGETTPLLGFAVSTALLTLLIAVPFRAVQIHELISDQLQQMPTCAVPSRCVVILNPNRLFYGADLVQNDPFLRSNTVLLISNGTEEDAQMMRTRFPGYRRQRQDGRGEVWVR